MSSPISGQYTQFHAFSQPSFPSAPADSHSQVTNEEVRYPKYLKMSENMSINLNKMLQKAGKIQNAVSPNIQPEEQTNRKSRSNGLGSRAASVLNYAPTSIHIDNSRRETNLFSTKNTTVINPSASQQPARRKNEDKEEEKMSRQTQIVGGIAGIAVLLTAANSMGEFWKDYRMNHAQHSKFVEKYKEVNDWAKEAEKTVKSLEDSQKVETFLKNIQVVYQKTEAILNRKETRPFVNLAFSVAALAVGGGAFIGAFFAVNTLLYGSALTGVFGLVVWLINYKLDSSLEDNQKDAKAISKAGNNVVAYTPDHVDRNV